MRGSLEHRIERLFDVATYASALATVPVVAAYALDPADGVRAALTAANWALWAVFALELVVMPLVARDGLAWLRRRPVTPAIVLLTLPPFAGLDLLRLLRLLRGRGARRLAQGVTSAEGLRNVALLTLLTVGFGGLVFAEMEPGIGAGDGLYWAVTTVTTTGYGDIVPTTDSAKVLAVVVMVVGAGFLAILTGAIAQRFIGRWRRDDAGPSEPLADAPAGAGGAADDPVLAKLDELGERLARLERAIAGDR